MARSANRGELAANIAVEGLPLGVEVVVQLALFRDQSHAGNGLDPVHRNAGNDGAAGGQKSHNTVAMLGYRYQIFVGDLCRKFAIDEGRRQIARAFGRAAEIHQNRPELARPSAVDGTSRCPAD